MMRVIVVVHVPVMNDMLLILSVRLVGRVFTTGEGLVLVLHFMMMVVNMIGFHFEH